ncbi:MAG: proton extrusion protein PcxA, partial [Cyanobacteriota bacterium]|nr:proton extrusion protein PcxA [Cyanobacteriota bacterium]
MSKLTSLWRQTTQWLGGNPERHLDYAFRSAVSIKEIEDQYFSGKKISPQSSDYSASALAYFSAEVNRHLQTIERQLAVYSRALAPGEPPPSSLEKLDFIDAILQRYASRREIPPPLRSDNPPASKNGAASRHQAFRQIRQEDALQKIDTASNKTGVLPRSFLRTVDRLRENMNPQSDEGERKVLNQYRNSRYKTALSVKFLLMLVIIPLLIHQLTKTFFLTPLVESYFEQHAEIVFINQNMEAEAYEELQKFEYSL